MAEYSDLPCSSNGIAGEVFEYLHAQLGQAENAPRVTACVEDGKLRLRYPDAGVQKAWDMQLLGYRDGIERAASYKVALERIVERGHGNHCNAHYMDDETGQPHPCSCHVALAAAALRGER